MMSTLVSSEDVIETSPPAETVPLIDARVWSLRLSTLTPPPTPTVPAAMPRPTISRSSLECASTRTSPFAFTTPAMVAFVLLFSTVTSTPGATPTAPKPAPAASATWWKSLADETTTDWPLAAPDRLEFTCAFWSMYASVCVSITFTAAATATPAVPPPTAAE